MMFDSINNVVNELIQRGIFQSEAELRAHFNDRLENSLFVFNPEEMSDRRPNVSASKEDIVQDVYLVFEAIAQAHREDESLHSPLAYLKALQSNALGGGVLNKVGHFLKYKVVRDLIKQGTLTPPHLEKMGNSALVRFCLRQFNLYDSSFVDLLRLDRLNPEELACVGTINAMDGPEKLFKERIISALTKRDNQYFMEIYSGDKTVTEVFKEIANLVTQPDYAFLSDPAKREIRRVIDELQVVNQNLSLLEPGPQGDQSHSNIVHGVGPGAPPPPPVYNAVPEAVDLPRQSQANIGLLYRQQMLALRCGVSEGGGSLVSGPSMFRNFDRNAASSSNRNPESASSEPQGRAEHARGGNEGQQVAEADSRPHQNPVAVVPHRPWVGIREGQNGRLEFFNPYPSRQHPIEVAEAIRRAESNVPLPP